MALLLSVENIQLLDVLVGTLGDEQLVGAIGFRAEVELPDVETGLLAVLDVAEQGDQCSLEDRLLLVQLLDQEANLTVQPLLVDQLVLVLVAKAHRT